jgi:hypothetical protein
MATYSFLDVQASIVGPGGAFSIGTSSGVAEEGITVRMLEDKNTMTIGADGTGMHSLHAGKSGAVEIQVLKTSPVNQQLRIMYDLQTASSSTHGKNTITVTNTESGDISTLRMCAFKKLPDLKYAKDGGMNTWTFDAIAVDGFMGLY